MSFGDAFQKIIDHPEKHKEAVLYSDEHVVIIKDLFPKATRHLLVIPRNAKYTHQHPLEVFNKHYGETTGEELYEQMGGYVEKAKNIIVEDLKDKLDLRNKAKDDDGEQALQKFRNKHIQAGVHSIPSLSNLHIHVITQDFHSPKLKNKKHYNSFTTKFFVPFEELNPFFNEGYYKLAHERSGNAASGSETASDQESDPGRPAFVRHVRNSATLESTIKNCPFKCMFCRQTFGNSMVKLKSHLKDEFVKVYGELGDVTRLEPNKF
ncbi:uncharacterized protein LODBEIA_P08160 [Lodderomyces beijingensis]|uniref:Aprataxin C2HE/C2H2/C2HC zinc finger domain-containing protein n=1 Tax=Lodderomyces beijingensis TaxID=1775926 RepID=A0ABP0ZGR4_9ASCO